MIVAASVWMRVNGKCPLLKNVKATIVEVNDMGFYLTEYFNEMNDAMKIVDETLDAICPFDSKTEELLKFALSIKARSAPCVRKHFKGAKKEGASDEEIAYVFALTMRESAGADDCWTHSVIKDCIEETGGSAGPDCDVETKTDCCGSEPEPATVETDASCCGGSC